MMNQRLMEFPVDHSVVPNEGETSDNVWYRIILTVTDSKGLKGKDSVDINPRKSTLNFATNPPGLQILLDGQPIVTPASVVSVEGLLRTVGVVTTQEKDELTYTFESWSNGGTPTQILTTPTANLTLTAQFSIVVGIENNLTDEIVVFPNPTKQDYVTVNISSPTEESVNLRMVDMLSREIVTQQNQLQEGANTVPFYFGKIKSGMYSIVVELAGKTISKRLIISD